MGSWRSDRLDLAGSAGVVEDMPTDRFGGRCQQHDGDAPPDDVLFVAWGAVPGRSSELVRALGGGRSRCFFPPGRRRPPVLLRWLLSAVGTVGIVARHRPSVLIVTNPPLPAALVGWAMGRLVGARVALDSHPGAFGAQGDRVAAKLLPLHKRLARHVDVSMVASEAWRKQVLAWGGDAVVLHEAPGDWQPTPARRHERLRVLCIGRFARDEPWAEVIGAAAQLPDCEIQMTGDPPRAELEQMSVSANVELVGYLDAARYRAAIEQCDVVICLTTEPESIMRSAYEAIWAGRPLIITDWPAGAEAFPHALRVDNEAEAIAAGIAAAGRDYAQLAARTGAARELALQRSAEQLAELKFKLGLS